MKFYTIQNRLTNKKLYFIKVTADMAVLKIILDKIAQIQWDNQSM